MSIRETFSSTNNRPARIVPRGLVPHRRLIGVIEVKKEECDFHRLVGVEMLYLFVSNKPVTQ